MTRRRGFLIVLALILLVLLLLLGIGFITQKVAQYRGAGEAAPAAQARAVAMAGLEDARVKLQKDINFPPRAGRDQGMFSYSEVLTDLAGNRVGMYTVTIDTRCAGFPWHILQVHSVGDVGDFSEPGARRAIRAELDLSEFVRGTSNPNPNMYRYINYTDEGGL